LAWMADFDEFGEHGGMASLFDEKFFAFRE
jgi:hypothetical protein